MATTKNVTYRTDEITQHGAAGKTGTFISSDGTIEYDLMKYNRAGYALDSAYWDIVVANGNLSDPSSTFIWSPELRRMLGYSDDEDYTDTCANWIATIHPDDRERVLRDFTAHLDDRMGTVPFKVEHRLRTKNGTYLCIRAFGTALRDKTGIPLRISGAVENITEAKRTQETLRHREKTLDILNRAALLFLSRKEKSFTDAISKGLNLIADITDLDRMSIFRNLEEPDGLHLSQIYRWQKDAHGTVKVLDELRNIPYTAISPRFEHILAAGESIAGTVRLMSERELLQHFGCIVILTIPVFDDEKFWGFVLFERQREKNFTERETDILRSSSLMLANVFIRHEEAEAIRRANKQSQIMLDALPIALTIWDKNHNVINCSQYAVDLFGFSSKRDLLDRFAGYVPEYQPCGKKSAELLAESSAEAFETGYSRLEWTHLTTSGEPILLDATVVRIKYEGENALMLFSRDIRKEKKMLFELVERDQKLDEQAHWYKSILDGIPFPIFVTDQEMNLVFTNIIAERQLDRKREELYGRHCSALKGPMCNTPDCSIIRVKQGKHQSFFKKKGLSYKVDSEVIRNMAGETTGYLEILQDVTEVENTARRQADTENEAKSAFLANMSHEMRTSLNAVIGLSELVLEGGGLSEDNESYLDKICNAGSTLLGIVNNILDLSKIEAGKFELIRQEYELSGIINDAITQNILRIHGKPIRFVLSVDENIPAYLYGDELRVKQILNNLLSNSFKYTERGTVEFRIDYEREDDTVWLMFRVSDTGIGISSDDLNRIFTDYTRFNEADHRHTSGTGLGLSITKKLVELMGGTIGVESEYGKGSVFTVRLRQGYAGDAIIGHETAELLNNFLYTKRRRHHSARLNRVSIPYARVLVVDDLMTNLDIARGLMKPYGMRVDCVTSGREAIDAIRDKKKKYNAVFMDHMMPDMDGIETVRIIREELGTEYAKTIPIIALTANAVAGIEERFMSCGFNAFISKPIDIFLLDEIIRRWVWDTGQESISGHFPKFENRRNTEDRRSGKDRRSSGGKNNAAPRLSKGTAGSIEGLDWAKGMSFFTEEESFRQVLRSFVVNILPLLDPLCDVSKSSLSSYAITVHGIKSCSRGIGANALGNLAESLEFAAKDGNLDFVSLHNPEFLKAAHKLIADIKAALANPGGTKPKKEKPGNTELARLGAACESYDLNKIEEVMRELEQYEYTADKGLVDRLCDTITQLNYTQVVEEIDRVIAGA